MLGGVGTKIHFKMDADDNTPQNRDGLKSHKINTHHPFSSRRSLCVHRVVVHLVWLYRPPETHLGKADPKASLRWKLLTVTLS